MILDLIMPVHGRRETFQSLKKLNPRVKVLLSSGYSINGLAQEILDRDAEDLSRNPLPWGRSPLKFGRSWIRKNPVWESLSPRPGDHNRYRWYLLEMAKRLFFIRGWMFDVLGVHFTTTDMGPFRKPGRQFNYEDFGN